jgi:adenine-specific DNA-methyltransferase
MLPINQIIQGECLEILQSFPDRSIDMICTDPPYFKCKTEDWDRQWDKLDDFLGWLDRIAAEWQRILKPNGSLYCFASPQMAARVEVLLAERFDILNQIIWNKSNQPGRHKGLCKANLRRFFPATESIIFCEPQNADSYAKGEAEYHHQCERLRGFVFEPLRSYLDSERLRANVSKSGIQKWFASHGYPKYVLSRHAFSTIQWELPTHDNYDRLRQCLNELGNGSFLRRDYEDLRRDYEDLRRDYEDLRRPFQVSAEIPYTTVWEFKTVFPRPRKHVCEKPLSLMEHMISTASRPGAIVLDCFAGSGSTLVAAQNLGRQFIGIELDAHWVQVATDRLHAAASPR